MVVKVVVGQKRLHKVWYVELNSLKFTRHDREIPIIIIRPSQPLSSLSKQKKVEFAEFFVFFLWPVEYLGAGLQHFLIFFCKLFMLSGG